MKQGIQKLTSLIKLARYLINKNRLNDAFRGTSLFSSLLFSALGFSQNGKLIKIPSAVLGSVFFVPDEKVNNIEVHFVARPGEAANHSAPWTTHLATGYWLTVAREDFLESLRSLARIFEPITSDTELMSEKLGIIQREHEFRVMKNPSYSINEQLVAEFYTGADCSRSIMDSPNEIAQYQAEEALAMQRLTHRPGNTSVLVYGNMQKKGVEAAFNKIFGERQKVAREPRFSALPSIEVSNLSS